MQCKMNPAIAMGETEHNVGSDENETILEQMLMEAERLAIQIRTAAGTGSNCAANDDISRSLHRTIPDSIDTFDNQTECSSIGLGHAVENLKWSPSVLSGVHEYRPKLTIPEETCAEDASGTIEPASMKIEESRLRCRSIKRRIEALVQKSKASVHLDTSIHRGVSSTSGDSEHDKLSNASNACTSKERTVAKSDICDETVFGSVATKYQDVQSVDKYEEMNENKQYEVSKINKFVHTNHQSPFVRVYEHSDDSEKESTSVSTSSHSNSNTQQPAVVSPMSTPPSSNEVVKSSKNHIYIANTTVVESGWINNNVVTRQDDDYVTIADYCLPKKEINTKNAVGLEKTILHNSVTWENVTSAKAGDDDFASVQDYSSTPTETYLASEFCERHHDKISGLSKYRALMARRASSKRKKFMKYSTLGLFMILLIQLNWKTILHIQVPLQNIINGIISQTDLSFVLETQTIGNYFTINWRSMEELKPIVDVQDFWFKIHPNMCTSQCLDYFDNVTSDFVVVVPLECYGAIDLHEDCTITQQQQQQNSKKRPIICSLPIVSALVPTCRGVNK
jgi:hypothetical protein